MDDCRISVGVTGCIHGCYLADSLEQLEIETPEWYASVGDADPAAPEAEFQRLGISPLFTLCPGDFEVVRHAHDISSICGPRKYISKLMNDKAHIDLCTGKRAPSAPLLVCPGNHESLLAAAEAPYGAWLTPHVFLLPKSGIFILRLRDGEDFSENLCRIVVLGGVLGPPHATQWDDPLTRHPNGLSFPANGTTGHTWYTIRDADVKDLVAASEAISDGLPCAMVTHDWPQGVGAHASVESTEKEHVTRLLQEDADGQSEFSASVRMVLDAFKPNFLSAAHHHMRVTSKIDETDFIALGTTGKNAAYHLDHPERSAVADVRHLPVSADAAQFMQAHPSAVLEFMVDPAWYPHLQSVAERAQKAFPTKAEDLGEVPEGPVAVPACTEYSDDGLLARTDALARSLGIDLPRRRKLWRDDTPAVTPRERTPRHGGTRMHRNDRDRQRSRGRKTPSGKPCTPRESRNPFAGLGDLWVRKT